MIISKPYFAKNFENKGADQYNAVTAQLISNYCFCHILIVQSLLVLNPKCHASTKPSSVVEQAVLCRTGRSPQGFPSFLSFFLSWKLIFICTVRFIYDKLNLHDINVGFVFKYFRAGIIFFYTKCVVYYVGNNLCRCHTRATL